MSEAYITEANAKPARIHTVGSSLRQPNPELPGMVVMRNMTTAIAVNQVVRHFPNVSEPLPGRYSEREGEKLDRDDLPRLVDEWLNYSDGWRRFVIQGGNRYISHRLRERGIEATDLKLSAIDKAPLSHHLLTLMTPDEKDELVTLDDATGSTTDTRRELLHEHADIVIPSPFSRVTHDDRLETELAESIDIIQRGITIPGIEVLRRIVHGTRLARELSGPGELHFVDDLFYRGRTVYALAVLIGLAGGDPQNMRLTTIGCDPKSRNLRTPYHHSLRPDVLYPFENSVRTEQGYWQDTGDQYEFTDMGAYLEHLHLNSGIRPEEAGKAYDLFHQEVLAWSQDAVGEGADDTLIFPLAWLLIYHMGYGMKLNIDKIIDQKGYRIGACAPFVALLDRFISQEETVDMRLHFKQQIKHQLEILSQHAELNPDGCRALMSFYRDNKGYIDYAELSRTFSI